MHLKFINYIYIYVYIRTRIPIVTKSDVKYFEFILLFFNSLIYNDIKMQIEKIGRMIDNIFIEHFRRIVKIIEHIFVYLNRYLNGLFLWPGLDWYFLF